MAPRKKTAAAAPVSALAARKAREQAEAQRSKTTRASTSKTDEATSTPRSSRRSASGRHDAQADLDGHENTPVLEVVLPLATASQESAHAALPPPPTSRRRSSVSQATSLIATSRPRRSSSTATSVKPGIGQSGSTPRATKGAATKTLQSTPSRGSARKVSSSSATPASSSKKRKATRTSEDDLDQAVQDILDELHFGNSDDDDDDNPALAASEQPPRKKRASQPSKSRTPVKSPVKSRSTMTVEADSSAKTKRTPVKRSSARSAPAEKTPSRKASAKAAESERPKRGTPANETTPSKRKSDERRSKAAQRYFAGSASSHGKTRVGSSSLPSEDQATGFLAFANDGDDDDDDDDDDESGATSAIGQQDETEEVQSDADTPNSSEDDEQQDEKVAGTSAPTPMPRRSKATRPPSGRKGKGRYVEEAQSSEMVLDSDEERPEDAQTAPPALTRASLLDAIPYSNFIPVPHGSSKNVHVVENKRKRGKEALYFGLRHGETLVFLGIGQVEVLKGSAQIGGAVISSSAEGFKMTQLYAPICNPLPVLKSVPQKQYPGQGVSQKVSHGTGLEMRDLPFGECDTVVKVSPLSSPITALGQVCPIGGLATPFSMPPHLELGPFHQLSTLKVLIAPETVEVAQKQKNVLANGTFSTVGLSATYVPHKWQNELHRLSASALSAAQHPQEESVIALVRGSKKVGKSTLSRMALERLRSMGASIGGKVAYLEMDLGQSDFGPPGMVALHVFSLDDNVQAKPQQDQDEHSNPDEHMHESTVQVATEQARRCITLGPGWCQPRVPARAHLIGDNSPRDDPESYVAAVHDLIEYFRAEIQPGDSDGNGDGKRVPLVINTQGWIKGLGADLAVRLEPMLRPTHIFDVVPRGSPDPVPAPSRGRPWLDADGAILGSGPEIVTLESVSQLEFVQGAFGQRDSNSSNNQHHASVAQNGLPGQADESKGSGDGGSTPPRYISDVGSKLQPAESRLLNMMSYLYATQLSPARIGNAYQTQGTWEFSGPLVDRPPLVIDVRQGLKAGIRVLPLGSSVPDELKLKAINSSIVAIVASQSSDRQADGENAEAVKGSQVGNIWKQAFDRAAQTSQPGRNPPTWCVGLGVVRSVDPESGSVHLLTPLSPAFLHELQSTSGCSFGLVKAALELPAWASLDFEAIKEARESRLDVPPSSFHALVTSEAAHTLSEERAVPLLAGMPRNQVPYLEWPHVAHAPIRQKGKHAGTHGNMQDSTSGSMPSTPVQLGSGKRRVRRNLMRKSQFA